MNFIDAAFEILKQTDKPLRYTEITARAQAAKLLSTKGQTPEATMGSRLYVDVKRPNSRFRQVSRGVFALKEAPPSEINQRIDSINRKTRNDLQKRLLEMAPARFELLMGELLQALGFEEETIRVTGRSGDGGIDVRGVLNAGNITEINAAVQVKRWKNNIHSPTVQALRGSLTVYEQGIIITTSKFSEGAIAEAKALGKVPISLIDGSKLLDLLIECKIGVVSELYTVYSLDEEWWSDVIPVETKVIIPANEVVPDTIYPLPIQGAAHKQLFQAILLDAQGRTKYDDTEYKSPSRAAMVATGWKTCNGWSFWRYQHLETNDWHSIDELRDKDKL